MNLDSLIPTTESLQGDERRRGLCPGRFPPRDILRLMATEIREQVETRFRKARDEYIASIKAHGEALESALKTESADVNHTEPHLSLPIVQFRFRPEGYKRDRAGEPPCSLNCF
jgi:hypothetical protein